MSRHLSGRRKPFVGRDAELERLSSIVTSVSSGDAAVVMPERACEAAHNAGGDVFWGRCYEGDGAPWYWPWVQILREYAEARSPEELRTLVDSGTAAITGVVPELADRLGPCSISSAVDDPTSARFRFLDAVATFLARAASVRPCLLGTHRNTDIHPGHPLYRALGDLARENSFERITLRALTENDVRVFISQNANADLPDALIEEIIGQGEGNPLFFGEILRLAQEEKLVTLRSRPSDSRVPEGLREVIARRLEHLNDDCRRALAASAVIGRHFNVSLLVDLLPCTTIESVQSVLQPAVDAGIVLPVDGPATRYEFTHVLLRQSLIAELPIAECTRLHTEVAAALESYYAEGRCRWLSPIRPARRGCSPNSLSA